MAVKLQQRINAMGIGGMSKNELRVALASLLDALQAVAAKLDADGGVTDTDYAATVAALIED
jgi:hypothetical protein